MISFPAAFCFHAAELVYYFMGIVVTELKCYRHALILDALFWCPVSSETRRRRRLLYRCWLALSGTSCWLRRIAPHNLCTPKVRADWHSGYRTSAESQPTATVRPRCPLSRPLKWPNLNSPTLFRGHSPLSQLGISTLSSLRLYYIISWAPDPWYTPRPPTWGKLPLQASLTSSVLLVPRMRPLPTVNIVSNTLHVRFKSDQEEHSIRGLVSGCTI